MTTKEIQEALALSTSTNRMDVLMECVEALANRLKQAEDNLEFLRAQIENRLE